MAVRGGLRTQVVATVDLAPLTMVFFQQVSLVGFVANLLAIPLVTLLITPLALLGLLLPPLWHPAGALVQGLSAVLQWLAAWPWAVWTAAAAPPWAVAAGLLAGLLAILPLPWRLRALALPLMLPLLWPPVERPRDGQFELVAADVGQGTAVLVRTHRHLLVYDAGPMYTPEADAAGRVLLPLLRGRGERRIDLLMLSHRDADHVGGAASLLRALPVSALSSSLAADHPLLAGLPHRRCDAGGSWVWDGVQFEVLHPLPADHDRGTQGNALSCVLRVQGAGGSALLTGDIESAQEAALVQRAAGQLRADVLIVPHHGSRTSSTPAFVDAVQPRVAVVQAAYRSRFGHPAPAVEARYADRGIRFVRSDTCDAAGHRHAALRAPCDAALLASSGGGVSERQPVT
jgi:competence protein ComEC